MNIIVALLIFTVIVVAHELGHFLLAKKNGVGVPEFSVGMGPRIITAAKTEKGFIVKFFCSQKTMDELEDSFNSKGVWARFSIVFAGPFFNFILAFVLAIIILANSGIDYPIVEYVYDNQPAQSAGIQVGDEIKSVNGHKITIGREIDTYTQLHPLTGKDFKGKWNRGFKWRRIKISHGEK